MARNGRQSQEILTHLLGTEEPLMIVTVIAKQMTLLWRIRSMQIQGRASDEDARALGLVWAWQVENIRGYAKNFPEPTYFERCFEYILEADLAIKSQPTDPGVAVLRLVSQLTGS